MSTSSEIKFTVYLDENKIPEKIEWDAEDSDSNGKKTASSIMLSIWDDEERVTYGIDLWTKDLIIHHLNIHMHQTLLKMADTYGRATNDFTSAELLRGFADEFARKLELINNPN
ncbi:MAG: gliding motility protein GldC [Ignavibacteriaceae bacterium]|nr:gliding motility protein GldC [Ignavibacteriaceae bacterium]